MASNLSEGWQFLTADRSLSSTALTMSVGHESTWAQRSCSSCREFRRNWLASTYSAFGQRAEIVALATAAAPAAATATPAGEMHKEPSAASLRFMAKVGDFQKTGHGEESTNERRRASEPSAAETI